MDITALTAKVETDKQAVTDAQTALDAANTTLAADQSELAQATLINQLEALTPDEVSVINNGLQQDGSSISLTLPPATT